MPADMINFAIILLYMEFAKLHILYFTAYFMFTSFVPERSNKKGARFAKARETVAFLLAQKSLAKNAFNNKLSSAYFRKRLYIAVKT